MTDDEMSKIVRAVLEATSQERIQLTDVPGLLDSWGVVDAEDKRGQGQALAAFMRHILGDPELRELMQLTIQSRHLTVVGKALSRIPVAEGYWEEHHKRERQIESRIEELHKKLVPKRNLLKRLAQTLKELGYDESFALPDVESPFPQA